MGVDIYYFYHGFGLKAFEGRHIRTLIILWLKFLESQSNSETKCYIHVPCQTVE